MEKEHVKHLNRKVAISVALISTFMALSKVKDDNIVQAMLQAKSDSVDQWNEYQSKKIKQHLMEMTIAQNQALALALPAKAQAVLQSENEKHKAEISRYRQEEQQIMDQARSNEAKYDALNFKDDQFDMSDAALSISLMLLAVTALTAEGWLLWTAWALGGIGILFGTAAFFNLHWMHPDWLVKILT